MIVPRVCQAGKLMICHLSATKAGKMSTRHSTRLPSGLLNPRLGIWCQSCSLLSGYQPCELQNNYCEIHHRMLCPKLNTEAVHEICLCGPEGHLSLWKKLVWALGLWRGFSNMKYLCENGDCVWLWGRGANGGTLSAESQNVLALDKAVCGSESVHVIFWLHSLHPMLLTPPA